MTTPSWAKIKAYLTTLDKDELLNVVRDLYQLNNDNKVFLATRLNLGQPEALAEPYKQAIRREFNPDRGVPGLSLRNARKALTTFKKVSADPVAVIDMHLYYVEQGVKCTNTYGDIDEPFYNSLYSVFVEAIKLIQKMNNPEIAAAFYPRFERIISDLSGTGWGIQDDLSDAFDNQYPR